MVPFRSYAHQTFVWSIPLTVDVAPRAAGTAVRALPASALQRRQLTTALWHAARLSVLSAQRASSARELQLTVPSRSAWKRPKVAQAAAAAHNVSVPGPLAEPSLRHAATSCTLDALVALERLETASNRFIVLRRIKEGIDGRSHRPPVYAGDERVHHHVLSRGGHRREHRRLRARRLQHGPPWPR